MVAEPSSVELWSSLRRRKVVQWGIAYVAARGRCCKASPGEESGEEAK